MHGQKSISCIVFEGYGTNVGKRDIFISKLVDRIAVVLRRSRPPGPGADDPVSELHPDALPDALLDLVVVLVGGDEVLVQRHQVVAIELLRLREVSVVHRALGLVGYDVGLADVLQGLENKNTLCSNTFGMDVIMQKEQ